jgi:ketosteroid isomerase-like protein
MPSQDEANVAVIRRCLEATLRDDYVEAFRGFDPDIEIEDHDIPDGEVYRGHGGYLVWLQKWAEPWESWQVEDVEVVATGDDRALALFRLTAVGAGSGAEVTRLDGVAYRLRDGKVSRIDYYNDQAEARAAAGL